MSDAQPLRQHEHVLKEFLKTEQDFAKNMAFLAALKPEIKEGLKRDLNKDASEEEMKHQIAVLAYLDSIEAIEKSSIEVIALFSQAVEMANKIEKGKMAPEEIQAHQKKLDTALDLHIKNISHSGYLFKQFNIEDYLNASKTPFPLNEFIQQWIIKKQKNNEIMHNNISILSIMPVQRIPRYALLAGDLERKLAEGHIPNVQAEHIAISAKKAAKAGEVLNEKVAEAIKKNRIEAFKKVLETNMPNSKQNLAKAAFELKEMIQDGVLLSQELQKEGIELGNLATKIKQSKKIESIQLQGPKEKQVGETAANVLSGYLKAGFSIKFDDSVHAAKLWQETLKKGMPDDKAAPIVIDLPPELLKNSALLIQAVKTAAMLQQKGFDVQATSQFKVALLEASQEKSYGFFNIVARIRQFNFKTDALQFANTVPTFQPTLPLKPKTAPLLLSIEKKPADLKHHKRKQQEAVNQAVMTPPKKEFLASPGALNKTRKHASHSLAKHRKQSPSEPTVKRPRND